MLRREFLASAAAGASLAVSGCGESGGGGSKEPAFRISLTQYSLHRRIGKLEGADPLDPLDFAATARDFGIEAVEYVSMLWREQLAAQGPGYLEEMRKRADDAGVQNLLIMVDREGILGAATESDRAQAVHNHERYLEAAAALGCRSIRVDPKVESDDYDEALKLMTDGLRKLCDLAQNYRLNVLVENEAGLGANADWLVDLVKAVDHPLAGLLPDFGNFWIDEEAGELYDPYDGIRKLTPHARALSAKSYGFDSAKDNVSRDRREGRELDLDFQKLFRIVRSVGYGGYVGIEYEGPGPEMEGIEQTKRVLDRLSHA